MMRPRIIAAVMIIMFIFTACSENKMTGGQTPENQVAHGTPDTELSVSEWTGTGGFYKLEEASTLSEVSNVTVYGGRLYCIFESLTSDNRVAYDLLVDSESVYRIEDKMVSGVAVSESGIWIAESYYSDGKRNDLILISQSGEIIRTVKLESVGYNDINIRSLLCTSGNLYIVASRLDAATRKITYSLIVLSEQGELVCSIDLSEKSAHAALGNDGQVYIREETAAGNDIYSVDLPIKSLAYCGNAHVCDGLIVFTCQCHNH